MAVPPITIGELNNVPAPLSDMKSNWAQDASGRIVHRFPSVAAMAASNLANGSVATALGTWYGRAAGVWIEFATQVPWTPWTPTLTDFAPLQAAPNPVGKYRRAGNVVDWQFGAWTLNSGAWGAVPRVLLPFLVKDNFLSGQNNFLGELTVTYLSAGIWYQGGGHYLYEGGICQRATIATLGAGGIHGNGFATTGVMINVAGRYEPA